MSFAPRAGERGFTLIEMIVSLALFALISLAGVALVRTVMDAQERTGGRIERLADLQRAMFLIKSDLEQFGGDVTLADNSLSFIRHSMTAIGNQPISYSLANGMMRRSVGTGLGTARDQRLLTGVSGLTIRAMNAEGQWQDRWPASDGQKGKWPRAISVEIALTPGPRQSGGSIRRVVPLPAQP
ncbi:MAG: prepilin-type cleavage/methylation domain-containing protein [Sphingomonas sanxanigenens]|uniref:Type II secretion system protein J n=1 Tax=Sphingomonas sanxanigenens TaxID=397260 RepID=A0A2W5CCH2_9SPHN|nr:MAG: prepilin-type cleavage/methylation domain-containing protein [Sphingomonas sanxanigenens]